MSNFSKLDVVLVRYPFSDLSGAKVRPAVVVNAPDSSQDLVLSALTSRVTGLRPGEFALTSWAQAGLHVPTAAKRGIFTLHQKLVLQVVGRLAITDGVRLDQSWRQWLGL
jgi:mRNA interferase MazF